MVRAQPLHVMTGPALLVVLGLSAGCVEHRTAVNPPLPAAPAAAGEPATITQLITGATVTDEPRVPITESSHLPIDVPVSVWRRDSDGTLNRGELRVTTALPWWQRFPADIVTDLAPIDAQVFASGTPTFTPVVTADRNELFAQAARDGYARRDVAPTSKDAPKDAPKEVQGKSRP